MRVTVTGRKITVTDPHRREVAELLAKLPAADRNRAAELLAGPPETRPGNADPRGR